MVNDGSELRRIDKLCVRYRKENALMREHLESHSEELEQAQQMRNVLTELQQRLEKQEEENELLQQLYARQVAQLAEQGFSAGQKTEAEKLKRQNHEFQQKVNAFPSPPLLSGITRAGRAGSIMAKAACPPSLLSFWS